MTLTKILLNLPSPIQSILCFLERGPFVFYIIKWLIGSLDATLSSCLRFFFGSYFRDAVYYSRNDAGIFFILLEVRLGLSIWGGVAGPQ